MYASIGTTERRASRHASAERADCEDVGADAAGSVFPDDPDEVATWTFEGYSHDQVLGVRYAGGSFGVFVAASLAAEDSRRIHADLSDD